MFQYIHELAQVLHKGAQMSTSYYHYAIVIYQHHNCLLLLNGLCLLIMLYRDKLRAQVNSKV